MEPQGQNAQLGKLLCGPNRPIDWSGLLPGADVGPEAEGVTSLDLPSHRRPAINELRGRVPWPELGLSRPVLDRLRAYPMGNRGSLLRHSASCL